MGGKEQGFVQDAFDGNWIAPVGPNLNQFEKDICRYTAADHCAGLTSGTAAIHLALNILGVNQGDYVIVQSFTFCGSANPVIYSGATPVFIDSERLTWNMCPKALRESLEDLDKKGLIDKVKAIIPVHLYGMPAKMDQISFIASNYGIPIVEDAAESIGSSIRNQQTGTFGEMGVYSFNGNKIITTGGGGMLLTDDDQLAKRAKHITTTAKIPHRYEFSHDEIGFNYRLPSLNAALGIAQMEQLPRIIEIKAQIAARYSSFFDDIGVEMVKPLGNCITNNWLNAIVLKDNKERNEFLEYTNENSLMTRPIWRLMSELKMFQNCQNDGLKNSKWLEERVVNLPSSVPNWFK